MTRIEVTSQVGADGILRLELPVGPADANRTVRVVVEDAPLVKKASQMTQEEWRAFVRRTAGAIQDPTFIRHPQGDYEEREEF